MLTSPDVLRASIESHNDAFESLLNLIPPKYYLFKEDADTVVTSKYQKHSKNRRAPKQAVKEASKKARREKLDPENQKSIIEIQNEAAFEQQKTLHHDGNRKGKRKAAPPSEDKDSDDHEDAMDLDGVEGLDDDDDEQKSTALGASDEMVPMPQVESITVLKGKLHARMVSLRCPGAQNDEPGDRDELLEERRKQRAVLREKRRKETKERKKAEAEGRNDKGKSREKDSKSKPASTKLLVAGLLGPSSGPPVNHNGPLTNVAFSALPGTTSKKAAQFKTASNPIQALAQLTTRKEKLAALPEEKRKIVQDRERWAKSEARVEGVKVKDNEAHVKKVIKQKEKARSKNKWEERKEQVAASMAAKQKKRTDNIAMRNERRNEKRKSGSGKSRPGFEGKSFSKSKAKVSGRKK
ncbi:Surfeit locus protein 6 domain containing protein [Tylopilus felleus]